MYNDELLFKEAVANFQQTYSNHKITLKDEDCGLIVNIDGEDKFNTTGYNLLYNLQRLCKELESELK